MRPIIAGLTALLLAMTLTACGERACGDQSPEDPAPAQKPATADQVQEDPFSAYFDLSALQGEALDQARQVIDQTQTADGVTVHVTQTIGDSRSLCVAFDMTYPEAIDAPDGPTTQLTLGSVGGSSEPGVLLDGGTSSAQTQETTLSCLAFFYYADPCLTGQEITLRLEEPRTGALLDFTWTAENTGFFSQADLVDETGAVVGSATLSPFFLSLDLPQDRAPTGDFAVTLLNTQGEVLKTITGQQSGAVLTMQLFAPLTENTVTTIQAESLTGTFS